MPPPAASPTAAATPPATAARPPLLRRLWPKPMPVDGRERLRVCLGAGLGLLVTAAVCHALGAGPLWPWLVAPMGASAVLVFGVPASPLAQPWSVLGGNVVSALVGIACARWLGVSMPTAALAVALAIGAMFALRCLHPPGGASALLMVLGAHTDFGFALLPVGLNSLLLAAAGIAYNNLSGRAYPPQLEAPPPPGTPRRFSDADLDAVLARHNRVVDIGRDELRELLEQSELQAYQRRLGSLRCADIMTPQVVTVEFGTPLADAWSLLRQHRVKALPVVDRWGHVVGIITQADYLRAADPGASPRLGPRLRRLLRITGRSHTLRPEVVGQIMTRTVRVVRAERPIADLLPLFSATGHHHVPVVGEGTRLVGIVTQSDLVRALIQEG